MKLSLRHETRYHFAHPMRGVVQSHRLMPASFEGQNVKSWSVSAEGAVFGGYFTDGAGDILRSMTVLGPVEELVIVTEGQVETADTSGILRGLRETVPPGAYCRTTRATRPDVALTELAESVPADMSALDRAHALAKAVAEAIRYEPGQTDEATTAAEALSLGAGVCQDHAHALIAVALIAGMPARYVTGYLLSTETAGQAQAVVSESGPQDQCEALRSGEASHAWAEVWVDNLGWVGFDVSNGCCPDDRYIRLGSGHDSTSAAPIRGIAHGAGEEFLEVSVSVQQIQQ